jgi:hypothetical protein
MEFGNVVTEYGHLSAAEKQFQKPTRNFPVWWIRSMMSSFVVTQSAAKAVEETISSNNKSNKIKSFSPYFSSLLLLFRSKLPPITFQF